MGICFHIYTITDSVAVNMRKASAEMVIKIGFLFVLHCRIYPKVKYLFFNNFMLCIE